MKFIDLLNKKDKKTKELLTKKEIDFIKELLRFGNYRDSEKKFTFYNIYIKTGAKIALAIQ